MPSQGIKAKKIKHNSSKKTVYYDSAVLKIYDFPIFYFPKFSHPDPTVDRKSGFLIPTFANSTNMGVGIDILGISLKIKTLPLLQDFKLVVNRYILLNTDKILQNHFLLQM